MSERKFKQLRAAGIVGPALELGPRRHVWTHADFEATVRRLPRVGKAPEPEKLAESRRERIAKLKSGAGGAA